MFAGGAKLRRVGPTSSAIGALLYCRTVPRVEGDGEKRLQSQAVRDAGVVRAGGFTFRSEGEDAGGGGGADAPPWPNAPHHGRPWWKNVSFAIQAPSLGGERPLPDLIRRVVHVGNPSDATSW